MAKRDLIEENQDLGVATDNPAPEADTVAPQEGKKADKVVPEGVTFGDDKAVAQ